MHLHMLYKNSIYQQFLQEHFQDLAKKYTTKKLVISIETQSKSTGNTNSHNAKLNSD